jgi:hypothetical protein
MFLLMVPNSDAHLEQIAASVGMPVDAVRPESRAFDRAAFWYRSSRGEDSEGNRLPTRQAPFKRRKKMEKVARDARRLLASMRIGSVASAVDGPGDPDILELLTYPKGSKEDLVLRLVGCVAELERLAREAAEEVVKLGDLIVPKNNTGCDLGVNRWIADMMSLYRRITGCEPATSVGGPEGSNPGVEGGPLIRLLEAAGGPLGINFSPAAWRSRVRSILALTDEQI